MQSTGLTMPLLHARLDYLNDRLVVRVREQSFQGQSGQMMLFQAFKDGNEFMQHICRDVLHPDVS